MLAFRHATIAAALATAVGGVLCSPAVHAADAVNAIDVIEAVAEEAAANIAEEQQLVSATDARGHTDTPAAAKLRFIDARGVVLLERLDALGVEVSEAARVALSANEAVEGSDGTRLIALPDEVYDTAIVDMLRVATSPEASIIVDDRSGGSNMRVLAIGAALVFIVGAAALAVTLRDRQDRDRLVSLAWSDGLTGLANRRRLDLDLETCGDSVSNVAVIMIDVDHFKRVNDDFGHQCGDETLRRIADTISANVRTGDVVYRYGGEEFCVLMPGASHADLGRIADRIVAAAHSVVLPDGDHTTISAGVAPPAENGLSSSIETADRALYQAKFEGRDRAVIAPAVRAVSAV